jgi:hypothetical protein
MRAIEVKPFEDVREIVVDSEGQPMGAGREPGLHVSTIINRLRKLAGGNDLPEDNQSATRLLMGFVNEAAIEQAFKSLQSYREGFIRQPKCVCEGIHMSPDGLFAQEDQFILFEFKATWKSMKQTTHSKDSRGKWFPRELHEALDDSFWPWMAQIQAYLHCLSEAVGQKLRRAWLWVTWVNGDYSYAAGRGPQVRVYELEFTDEEVAQNWHVLKQAAESMASKGGEGR